MSPMNPDATNEDCAGCWRPTRVGTALFSDRRSATGDDGSAIFLCGDCNERAISHSDAVRRSRTCARSLRVRPGRGLARRAQSAAEPGQADPHTTSHDVDESAPNVPFAAVRLGGECVQPNLPPGESPVRPRAAETGLSPCPAMRGTGSAARPTPLGRAATPWNDDEEGPPPAAPWVHQTANLPRAVHTRCARETFIRRSGWGGAPRRSRRTRSCPRSPAAGRRSPRPPRTCRPPR